MSGELWLLMLGCAVVTFAIKAVGPVAFGGRDLPGWFAAVIALMAPALLAALVVTRRSPTASACTWARTPPASRRRACSSGAAASIMPAVGLAVVVTRGVACAYVS